MCPCEHGDCANTPSVAPNLATLQRSPLMLCPPAVKQIVPATRRARSVCSVTKWAACAPVDRALRASTATCARRAPGTSPTVDPANATTSPNDAIRWVRQSPPQLEWCRTNLATRLGYTLMMWRKWTSWVLETNCHMCVKLHVRNLSEPCCFECMLTKGCILMSWRSTRSVGLSLMFHCNPYNKPGFENPPTEIWSIQKRFFPYVGISIFPVGSTAFSIL